MYKDMTENEKKVIDKITILYTEQNIKDPDDLSLKTGIPLNKIKSILENNIQYAVAPREENNLIASEKDDSIIATAETTKYSSRDDRLIKLNKYLDITDNLIDKAKWAYELDDEPDKAAVVNSLIATASNLIKDLENYEAYKSIGLEVIEEVLPILIKDIVMVVMESYKDIVSEVSSSNKFNRDDMHRFKSFLKDNVRNKFENKINEVHQHAITKVEDLYGIVKDDYNSDE